MSQPNVYSRGLYHMTSLMKSQMEANVEKTSFYGPEKTLATLRADLVRNLNKLALAEQSGNVEDAWRRAANVANYAWMIAARLEHDADHSS